MAKAWAMRIISDPDITIENVPKSRKSAVLAILAAEGLDGYGNPLEDE